MNSLEFINQEIHFISVVKKEYEKMLNDERSENQKGYLKTLIKEYEDKLQTLHHIKTELEAWEVVKKYGVAYLKEKNYLELSLIYANCPKNKQYQKLKKALEVENEKEN